MWDGPKSKEFLDQDKIHSSSERSELKPFRPKFKLVSTEMRAMFQIM
jgi:hypothetical protein